MQTTYQFKAQKLLLKLSIEFRLIFYHLRLPRVQQHHLML